MQVVQVDVEVEVGAGEDAELEKVGEVGDGGNCSGCEFREAGGRGELDEFRFPKEEVAVVVVAGSSSIDALPYEFLRLPSPSPPPWPGVERSRNCASTPNLSSTLLSSSRFLTTPSSPSTYPNSTAAFSACEPG